MERGFQALLLRGEGESSGDSDDSPPPFIGGTAGDVACIDALYSAMIADPASSFLYEKYLLQSLEYGYGTLPAPTPSGGPMTYGYDVVDDWKPESVSYVYDEKLKMPKYEKVDYELVGDDVVWTEPPFDFISRSSTGSNSRLFDPAFGVLPSLLSLEPVQDSFGLTESPTKRVRSFSPATSSNIYSSGLISPENESLPPLPAMLRPLSELARQKLSEKTRCSTKLPFEFISKSSESRVFDSTFGELQNLLSLYPAGLTESPEKRVRSFSPATSSSNNCFTTGLIPPENEPLAAPAIRGSELARQRRKRISEKTRCLQKMMPWDKKMDTTTMLEEAYKYVKFLKAQVSVLQSMPLDSSSFFSAGNPCDIYGGVNVFGVLGRLNRQQLLQVMVNSPVVQTALCSKGLCVYSIEQLVYLKKDAERKALHQQMGLNPFQ